MLVRFVSSEPLWELLGQMFCICYSYLLNERKREGRKEGKGKEERKERKKEKERKKKKERKRKKEKRKPSVQSSYFLMRELRSIEGG